VYKRQFPAPHGDVEFRPEDCKNCACSRGAEFRIPCGEASNSVKQEIPLITPKNRSGKFYAVRKGYRLGIFTTWSECEIQVKGYPGCEFRSFKLYEDAVRYLGFSP
jgi:hypothetical protein